MAAKKVDFKIGPESNYNANTHKDVIYLCNDTLKAYIPQETVEKDTGWIPMLHGDGYTKSKTLFVRQVGKVVQITGSLVPKDAQKEDTYLAIIPSEIGIPTKSVYYHHNNISDDSKNTGIDCYVEGGTRNVRWRRINSYWDNNALLTFTYLTD